MPAAGALLAAAAIVVALVGVRPVAVVSADADPAPPSNTPTGETRSPFTDLPCGTTFQSATGALSVPALACQGERGSSIAYRFAFSNRADQDLMPAYGFNLIDVSSKEEADATPAGTRGLVWLGDYDNTTCSWEADDATVRAKVEAMAGDPKVAGYFFANESDPFGCPDAVAAHRARNALIKSIDPSKFTLITVDSNSGDVTLRQIPLWAGAADYIDYNPYICHRGEPCDFAWLDTILAAADQAGNPYFIALQAFGDSEWRWPTAAEEKQMLDRLKTSAARGYMTFSWNWNDDPLIAHPGVLDAIKAFNLETLGDTTAPSAPAGLTSPSATATSVTLSWSPASDDTAVTGYDVFARGVQAGETTTTGFTVSDLRCGTDYTFAVEAADASANRSAQTTLTTATSACAGDPVIVAVGDICEEASKCRPTATLVDSLDFDRLITLGDAAYEDGSLANYTDSYDPNFGRHKSKTSPTPGNHDYHVGGAADYFTYFGARAPGEYYSFDLGTWHVVSLDGDIDASAGSRQETWLKNDLAAHPSQCVLAYWHEPRFSSGSTHGGSTSYDAFWRDLHAAGADVVLNGHEHSYERFAPQTPDAAADPNGIREFVVGTGGGGLYGFGPPAANSVVRDNTTFGVIEMTLRSDGYDWRFVPVAGGTFSDSGSGDC